MSLDRRLVGIWRQSEQDLVDGARPPFVPACREPRGGFGERSMRGRAEDRFCELARLQQVEPSEQRREPPLVAPLAVEASQRTIHLPRLDPREVVRSVGTPRCREKQLPKRCSELIIAYSEGGPRGAFGVACSRACPGRPSSAAGQDRGHRGRKDQRYERIR